MYFFHMNLVWLIFFFDFILVILFVHSCEVNLDRCTHVDLDETTRDVNLDPSSEISYS